MCWQISVFADIFVPQLDEIIKVKLKLINQLLLTMLWYLRSEIGVMRGEAGLLMKFKGDILPE